VYPYVRLTDFEKKTIKSLGDNIDKGSAPFPADTPEYVAQKILDGIGNSEAEIYAHDWMKKMGCRSD
jgi:hypothetical protein